MFGISRLIDWSRSLRRGRRIIIGLSDLPAPRRLVGRQIGDDGLAGDHALTYGDQGLRARRQIDIDPAAEPDQPEPLAGAKRLPLLLFLQFALSRGK